MNSGVSITGIGLACLCIAAGAENLGAIGPTYPIREQNLLAMIEQRLKEKEKSGELARLREAAIAKGRESVVNPVPVIGPVPGHTARTFYFDPTYVLEKNVVDAAGNILYLAGTRKNPLEIVSMGTKLLFFDGRDPKQVQAAKELIDGPGGRVKPILIAGSYLNLMKKWGKPVFYDQQGKLIKRFNIRQVPALVSQEGMRLRIDEWAQR